MGKAKDTANPARCRSDLSAEQVGQDLLLLDKRNEKIHQLNETASAVWRSIGLGIDPDGIVKNIVEEFDVSMEVASKHVQEILREFQVLGLLSTSGKDHDFFGS